MIVDKYDVIIIGAGAAGLMASAVAASRGKRVLLIEATSKIGEKIRISGGGRCNFTNIGANDNNYLSQNPHFIKSALSQYSQYDFIKLVESYNIAYHEKTLGQLFCDSSSKQIIEMLVSECRKHQVEILLDTNISNISKESDFILSSNRGNFTCNSLIIATGGLSIPKMGATDFGYKIAKKFNINLVQTRPALVPLTVSAEDLEFYKNLSGIAINSIVSYDDISFRENILFTHRGLSGPAILQISSYLTNRHNQEIALNLLPGLDLKELLLKNKQSKILITNFLKDYLPNRFVDHYCQTQRLVDFKPRELESVALGLHNFKVKINGTEGYAKAEVTAGGVDTRELSSKTMECLKIHGLYFIGEIVDVTGWLGGYNFQWAWSSGYVAGLNA